MSELIFSLQFSVVFIRAASCPQRWPSLPSCLENLQNCPVCPTRVYHNTHTSLFKSLVLFAVIRSNISRPMFPDVNFRNPRLASSTTFNLLPLRNQTVVARDSRFVHSITRRYRSLLPARLPVDVEACMVVGLSFRTQQRLCSVQDLKRRVEETRHLSQHARTTH